MDVPALVQASLGDEDVAAHVSLKGEDALFVTPTRTLLFTADGLLSDESVEEYPHDAEGVDVSDGRRKASLTLDYGVDGEESFAVPSGKVDDVLHPILAGVLSAAEVTEPGETVKRTYRFSELTLVVTSDRVAKHVGSAVWGPDHEVIAFDTVTGIDNEEGSVSSQLVLETTRRNERIKAPNEQFRDVRETVEDALFAYHDVDGAAEFAQTNVTETDDDGDDEVSFGGGVDPIDTSGVGEDDEDATAASDASTGGQTAESQSAGGQAATGQTAGAQTAGAQAAEEQAASDQQADAAGDDEFESSGFETATASAEPAVDPEDLDAELAEMESTIADLAETLERQREVIDAQQDILAAQRERIEELRALASDE